MISDVNVNSFNERGYLIFEGLLKPGWVDPLKAEIDEMMKKGNSIAALMPTHSALVTHTALMGIAHRLMGGTEYGFHHMHSARHDAGMPEAPWHHDYEQYPSVDREFTMIHFFMYVSGLNGTIGDLVVIPGSHTQIVDRYRFSQFGTSKLLDTEVVINDLPPGSVVAIHSGLLHARRAMPGGEDNPRYFVDSSFCQAGRRWPSYKERGNWRETLQMLRERDAQHGSKFQFVFNEDNFY